MGHFQIPRGDTLVAKDYLLVPGGTAVRFYRLGLPG
jgi:hypothetical protein